MSDTSTLRMPEHVVPEPHKDAQDRFHARKGVLCRAGFVPGYAHMNPGSTLLCNRCGWVTPEPVVTSYSSDTDCTYLTWDDLVAAEAEGYVVVGTVSRPRTVPMVVGTWPPSPAGKKEANKARARLRRYWAKQEREDGRDSTVTTFVRPLWKDYR